MGAGHTGENMLENKGTITPLWHNPVTSVTPEAGVCDSCSFPTRTKEEDKYKVINETLLQLNVTTTERKKKKKRQVGIRSWVCQCSVW